MSDKRRHCFRPHRTENSAWKPGCCCLVQGGMYRSVHWWNQTAMISPESHHRPLLRRAIFTAARNSAHRSRGLSPGAGEGSHCSCSRMDQQLWSGPNPPVCRPAHIPSDKHTVKAHKVNWSSLPQACKRDKNLVLVRGRRLSAAPGWCSTNTSGALEQTFLQLFCGFLQTCFL